MQNVVDTLAVLKIHYPLDRQDLQSRRHDCVRAVSKRTAALDDAGVTAVLITDHNTHGRIPAWGGRALFPHGLDYIGVAHAPNGARLEELRRKKIRGTIDGHSFIAVRVRVTWPSGRKTKLWFVQANLGRGVTEREFHANALRIKKAIRGHFVIGFDEIDEADTPNEHSILKEMWSDKSPHFCAWESLSPVLVSKRLRVLKVQTTVACEGLARRTPHRDLNEITIAPPKRLRDRFKS